MVGWLNSNRRNHHMLWYGDLTLEGVINHAHGNYIYISGFHIDCSSVHNWIISKGTKRYSVWFWRSRMVYHDGPSFIMGVSDEEYFLEIHTPLFRLIWCTMSFHLLVNSLFELFYLFMNEKKTFDIPITEHSYIYIENMLLWCIVSSFNILIASVN